MSEQPMDRADLERDLRALATAIDWPPTPDVAGRVHSRLAGAPAPVAGRSWLPTLRLARPALLALLLLMVLAVAIAAAIAFGLPGLRITFTSDPLPTPNVPAATATGTTPVRTPTAAGAASSRPAGRP